MRQRGLTLVEILIVLAIIAVASAIAFPIYARAKATAHQTTCLSNVRQITAALLMYMDEYRYAPIGSSPSWLTPLGLERKKKPVLKCPLFRPKVEVHILNDIESGYAANSCLNPSPLTTHPMNPSRMVAVTEKGVFVKYMPGGRLEDFSYDSQGPDCLRYNSEIIKHEGFVMKTPYGCSRHLGGSNYGMLDGRAVWRRPSQIRYYDGLQPCLMRGSGKWIGPSNGISFQNLE